MLTFRPSILVYRRLVAGHVPTHLAALPRGLSTSSTNSPPPPPRPTPSRWARFVDDARDVFSVAFGVERARDIEAEYDAGLREYPWVTYVDAAGARVYRNRESGATTADEPADFQKRATPAHWLESERVASAVTVVKTAESAWDRTLRALGETPLIAGLLSVGEAVAKGPVGQVAKKVGDKATEVKEDLLEKWETSQHPVVVNAA